MGRVREALPPLFVFVTPMPYVALQQTQEPFGAVRRLLDRGAGQPGDALGRPRLGTVRYDPDHVFHLNANIHPAFQPI